MQSRNWRDVAEFVGIAAIVASLVFVGVQLRQEHRIAAAESLETLESSAAATSIMIAEHADIWLKSRNDETLSDTDQVVINRLVANMFRRARYAAAMRRELGFDGTNQLRDFAIELYENPGARRIWKAQIDREIAYFEKMTPSDDYRRSYRDEVVEELAKLDSIND